MVEKLNSLLSEILRIRVEDIGDGLSIGGSDTWDSLSHMQLVVGIEESFEIALTADEIVAMNNVGEIKRILHLKGVDLQTG